MPERSLSPCIQIPICNTKITLFPELNLPIRVHGTNVRLRMQSGCRVGQKLVKPTFVVKPLFPSFVVQPKASILVKIGGRGGARFCSVLLFFFCRLAPRHHVTAPFPLSAFYLYPQLRNLHQNMAKNFHSVKIGNFDVRTRSIS